MKDNLEDLLKQLYGKKEVPSQEFCQSVIQKMQEKSRRGFFWKREEVNYKGVLLAAICAGIIILAGMGIQLYRQGKFQGKGSSWKQEVAERENPTPDITEEPVRGRNGDKTGNPAEDEKPAEAGNQVDGRNSAEAENPSSLKNKAETNVGSDDGQKDPGGSNGRNTGYSSKRGSANLSGGGGGSSTKPEATANRDGGSNAEGMRPDSDTGPENRKPQTRETMGPTETSKPKPMLPSKTMQPQRTPNPQENYISVCSIETITFSSRSQIPPGEEVCFPDSLFDSQLILSYEQLQTLIGDIEENLAYIPDDGLQKILLQLRGYDPSYFVSNALCVNLSKMDVSMDVSLQAVWIRNMGEGDPYLEVLLNLKQDGTEQPSGKYYYSSFVSVPQTLARQCSMVQFRFSE